MITQHQLRRYQLQKQGLLERLPPSQIPALAPFSAEDYTTPYLSLLARIEPFRWEDYADLRYDERAFSRWPAMRGQTFVIPETQMESVHCLYRLAETDVPASFAEYGLDLDEADAVSEAILRVLERVGPQSNISLKQFLPPEMIRLHRSVKGHELSNIVLVLQWLWRRGLLEAGTGVHHWRSKDNEYRLIPALLPDCDRMDAAQRLAIWYFETYAPAAFEDWADWCGLEAGLASAAFAALKLTPITVEDMPETLYMLDADELHNTPDEIPEMARLLPFEDAFLNAYSATRYRFFDEEGLAEDIAFNRRGQAQPTLWLDGRIIGIWSWIKKDDEPMTVEPFEQITKTIRRRLKPEVERVAAFVNTEHILWTV